jgi:hypothetical protein
VASPGQTVSVAAGAYGSQNIPYSAAKAAASSRVLFDCNAAANFGLSLTGSQHLEFAHCDINGLSATAQNRSDPSSPEVTDVVVRDGRIKDFYITGVQHFTIQRNDIGHYVVEDMGVSSIYSDNGQPTARDVKILDNWFRGVTVLSAGHNECLFVKRIDGLVIARNKFIGCPGLAIAFYDAQVDPAKGYAHASNIVVENNFLQCRPLSTCYGGSMAVEASTKGYQRFINFTFRFNSSDGSIAFLGGCDATLCQNVVAYGNATGGSLSCSMTQSYNLGSSCGGSNSATKPTFVDANAGDFHAAPGSAALGFVPAGFCAGSSCPATDVDGDARTTGVAVDAGADER